jgi:ABC-2 type transport system permease protein
MNRGIRHVWLVTRREWNQRAGTTAFRISTLVTAAIVVLLIMVPEIYGGGEPPARTVGVVGTSDPELPQALEITGDQIGLKLDTRTFAERSAGESALRSGDVAVLVVDDERLVWASAVDRNLRAAVESAVGALDRRNAVAEYGLTDDQARRLLGPTELPSTSLEPASEERTARADLGRVGVVLLFMAIAFYCGFVLMGVVEEKSSRVVEVLLSRLRPAELLAGKILGIGLVGLAQMAIVILAALVAISMSDNTELPETTAGTLGWIGFWFVLGYGFYAVLYAAAGSLVSRQEETQSLSLPMTLVLLVAYVAAFAATESPDGTAALLGSLFPPTAPMVMIVRIAHGDVPPWQILASVVLTLAATYGLVRLAARVYAGGALRFGGRVALREAWRGAAA